LNLFLHNYHHLWKYNILPRQTQIP